MDLHSFDPLATSMQRGLSRRSALGRLVGGGLAAALLAGVGLRRRAAAQDVTPMIAPPGWRAEHLEVVITPVDPVSITRAGGGPPQRGDFFHIDAPIFAAGDVNGTEIGRYQCFGSWTHAADDTSATEQRLTTVQYAFADGAIMGLINEGGTEAQNHIGAVQGGTGKYAGALGVFRQMPSAVPGVATPGAAEVAAPGTPAPGQIVAPAVFELLLPAGG
jgi:hypothetical protein